MFLWGIRGWECIPIIKQPLKTIHNKVGARIESISKRLWCLQNATFQDDWSLLEALCLDIFMKTFFHKLDFQVLHEGNIRCHCWDRRKSSAFWRVFTIHWDMVIIWDICWVDLCRILEHQSSFPTKHPFLYNFSPLMRRKGFDQNAWELWFTSRVLWQILVSVWHDWWMEQKYQVLYYSKLDESLYIWFQQWTFSGWVFCPCKLHPVGN